MRACSHIWTESHVTMMDDSPRLDSGLNLSFDNEVLSHMLEKNSLDNDGGLC